MTGLLFFLAIAAVGSLLVFLAIVAVGWWETATIDNWQFAAKLFGDDFPEHRALSGSVAENGRSALLLLEHGNHSQVGVVTVFGDRWNTRLLKQGKTRLEPYQNGLCVQLDDVTFPKLKIPLERPTAVQWLAAFRRSAE